MSEGRAVDVIERLASMGRRVGSRTFFGIVGIRKLIAHATEAQLVVERIHVLPSGTSMAAARAIEAPSLESTTTWESAVFRANASALAEVDHLAAQGHMVEYAGDLIGRTGYWTSRSHLPIAGCADDELEWRLASLSSTLGAAGAAGIPPDAASIAELDALRAELARRVR
jgi:hypothetical protein